MTEVTIYKEGASRRQHLLLPRAVNLRRGAGDEIIAAGSGVGDEGVEVSVRVEDDTVRAGGATREDLEAGQDRVLVPGTAGGERESLVVVVLVGVAVCKGKLGIRLLYRWATPAKGKPKNPYQSPCRTAGARHPSAKQHQCPTANSSSRHTRTRSYPSAG